MKGNIIAALLLMICSAVHAGENEKVKTGLNFAPYPVIGFSTDLGAQYGINCTIYNYGDGSIFPNYKHKLNFEASKYTKGQVTFKGNFNSDYLIPGIRFSAALAYQNNPMYHFYGINGSATPYHKELDHRNGNAYYNVDRTVIRAFATFQGEITEGLKWAAGANFYSYTIGSVDRSLGYDSDFSLYNDYIREGFIRENEAGGGNVFELIAGLAYDTRDALSIPSKGIWSELFMTGSPDAFNDGYSYLKLNAQFRHYIGILDNDRLTFAYNIAYQGLLCGEMPFYVLQNLNALVIKKTIYEGLGNKNTIRGSLYNRFLGNSYFWSNFELRMKLFSFNAIRQSFYIAMNPFLDCGAIVEPFRMEHLKGTQVYKDATKLHESAGMGLKLVMNRNFIMSFEAAKPFNPDDGRFDFIMGANYLF